MGPCEFHPFATRVISSVFADMTSRAETTRLVRYSRRSATYRLAAPIGEPSSSFRGSSRTIFDSRESPVCPEPMVCLTPDLRLTESQNYLPLPTQPRLTTLSRKRKEYAQLVDQHFSRGLGALDQQVRPVSSVSRASRLSPSLRRSPTGAGDFAFGRRAGLMVLDLASDRDRRAENPARYTPLELHHRPTRARADIVCLGNPTSRLGLRPGD